MSTDEKALKILDELQSGQEALAAVQKALQDAVRKQGEQIAALQDDVSAVKTETGKIPAIEQRLDHHGKLLTGLTANMATVLEEQQAQRSDIRSLHTEVHESREEVKGEIEEVKGEVRAAREEAKRDNIDLKAAVVKKIYIPLDLVVNRWLHRVRAAHPVSSCCYTSSDDVSSPDEISHKLSNINGLRFYH